MSEKLIVSLTTYPKRWDCLQIAIRSVLDQSYYDKVDLFYINVDDNLSKGARVLLGDREDSWDGGFSE